MGKLDEHLKELGQEIQNINRQLASYKKLTNVKPEQEEWRKRAICKLKYLTKEYSNLKAKSKAVHEQLNKDSLKIIKEIIKDFYGDKEFERCINELIEREKAYTIDSTMNLDYYTRSKGALIKKI